MISPLLRGFLGLSGLIAATLGVLILLSPIPFYAGYGIDLTGQVDLLNEMRSHGLSLIGIGGFIAAGAVLSRLATAALAVSALFYLSYGLSRLVSLVLDGPPGQALLLSTAFELAVGAISLFAYLRRRRLRLFPATI